MEDLFSELEYTIRYERGTFQSGYCLVEKRKIAVINRFFDAEARINTLMDILSTLEVDVEKLTEKTAEFYHQVKKAMVAAAEAEDAENQPSS